jgi:hypothetical protein
MTIGTPPGTGPQLVDGLWLAGIAGGLNQTYQAGLTAPNAASQATATVVPSGISLVEVDTSVANGSLVLPAAIAGTEISIINNTANTLNIYANAAINQATGALDTINALANASPFTGATLNSITWIACAKNGKWYTK